MAKSNQHVRHLFGWWQDSTTLAWLSLLCWPLARSSSELESVPRVDLGLLASAHTHFVSINPSADGISIQKFFRVLNSSHPSSNLDVHLKSQPSLRLPLEETFVSRLEDLSDLPVALCMASFVPPHSQWPFKGLSEGRLRWLPAHKRQRPSMVCGRASAALPASPSSPALPSCWRRPRWPLCCPRCCWHAALGLCHCPSLPQMRLFRKVRVNLCVQAPSQAGLLSRICSLLFFL